jgi:UDP-glucuronate decarboxylase
MGNEILAEDLDRIHEVIKKRGDWYGAVIVITGCAGFLGFYFMQYFARYGKNLGVKKIIGLDNFLLGQPDWIASVQKDYPNLVDLRKFDISRDKIEQVNDAKEARYVVHGASIASPSFYRIHPIETVDANIWGLRGLLDFYRSQPALKGFLFFSSSEIYGDPDLESIPTDEEYRGNVSCHGPRACYDESKRFGETLSWIYAKQFNMPITIARPFNNYGPGMSLSDKRLPADFAKSVLSGRDLTILSDGTPTRTFCYISDAIIGYLLCLIHGSYNYFNIGMDEPEITVREFAKIFQKSGAQLFNYRGAVNYQISEDPEYMTDNPNRRCPVIKKASDILGYSPKVYVEEGVHRYLSFLKQEGLKK